MELWNSLVQGKCPWLRNHKAGCSLHGAREPDVSSVAPYLCNDLGLVGIKNDNGPTLVAVWPHLFRFYRHGLKKDEVAARSSVQTIANSLRSYCSLSSQLKPIII